MEANIYIERIRDTGVHNLGRAVAYRSLAEKPFHFVTLEPTWLLNQSFISCIKTGTYVAVKSVSPKFGDVFELQDVEGRSHILFHALNFFNQTEGCIGVGSKFAHINTDGHVDIAESGKTMKALLELMPERFKVTIVDHEYKQTQYVTRNSTALY